MSAGNQSFRASFGADSSTGASISPDHAALDAPSDLRQPSNRLCRRFLAGTRTLAAGSTCATGMVSDGRYPCRAAVSATTTQSLDDAWHRRHAHYGRSFAQVRSALDDGQVLTAAEADFGKARRRTTLMFERSTERALTEYAGAQSTMQIDGFC